jgi:hypothetical protein
MWEKRKKNVKPPLALTPPNQALSNTSHCLSDYATFVWLYVGFYLCSMKEENKSLKQNLVIVDIGM